MQPTRYWWTYNENSTDHFSDTAFYALRGMIDVPCVFPRVLIPTAVRRFFTYSTIVQNLTLNPSMVVGNGVKL